MTSEDSCYAVYLLCLLIHSSFKSNSCPDTKTEEWEEKIEFLTLTAPSSSWIAPTSFSYLLFRFILRFTCMYLIDKPFFLFHTQRERVSKFMNGCWNTVWFFPWQFPYVNCIQDRFSNSWRRENLWWFLLKIGCSLPQLFLSSIDFKLEIHFKTQGDQCVHIFFPRVMEASEIWRSFTKVRQNHGQKHLLFFVRGKADNGK